VSEANLGGICLDVGDVLTVYDHPQFLHIIFLKENTSDSGLVEDRGGDDEVRDDRPTNLRWRCPNMTETR
jgi:hypothetical protein